MVDTTNRSEEEEIIVGLSLSLSLVIVPPALQQVPAHGLDTFMTLVQFSAARIVRVPCLLSSHALQCYHFVASRRTEKSSRSVETPSFIRAQEAQTAPGKEKKEKGKQMEK